MPMNQYPKQLIDIFKKNLNEKIESFHKNNQDMYNLPRIEECIENTLDDYLDGTTQKKDIQEIITAQKKTYRTKKVRLYKKVIENNEKYKATDEKSLFYFLIQQKNILTEEQWQMLYNNNTLQDVINDTITKIEKWKSDKEGLLIDYPLFNTLSNSNKIKAFYHDMFMDLMDITKKKMNGNLEEFYKTTPTFMTETPVFANTKMNILMNHTDTGRFEYLFDNQDSGYQLKISSNTGTGLKMLDEVDNIILNSLINHTGKDFFRTRTVHTTIGTLVKAIYPNKRPGAAHYNMVKMRLKNMMSLQYEYKDAQKDAIFNIFDNVIFERPDITENVIGTENVDIMMGTLMYESIVDKKMVYVTKNNYDALENKLSKLLCYALQKERVALAAEGGEMSGEYDYVFFSKAIMFKEKKKKNNIQLIQDSLAEFVEKQIEIEKFELKRDVFKITFIPLSESEKEDLGL